MQKVASYLSTALLILIVVAAAPPLITNIAEQYHNLINPKTKVGRLKIINEIDDHRYQEHLEKLFKNPAIKAVLLDIEGPGGAIGSAQCLYQELMHYKTMYKKPVVALARNVCTSGAYYVACASDYIISTPSAIMAILAVLSQTCLGQTCLAQTY